MFTVTWGSYDKVTTEVREKKIRKVAGKITTQDFTEVLRQYFLHRHRRGVDWVMIEADFTHG